MAKRNLPKIELTPYDEIFSTEKERQEAKLSKIYEIPIEEIDDFPDHPYQVKNNEDMQMLMESIRENGVITPATVRKKEDGRYEMLSGHRRKYASRLLGAETLRCEVVEMDKDAATIFMVESNFQRSEILPSEKAFAYKMRMEAMKRKAGRPLKNMSPVGTNLRTDEQIASETGDSRNQIHRYIRLTELVPELLEMVDEGRMKMRPAVELSYLSEEAQRDVVDAIDEYVCTPSHNQAIRMRRMFDGGMLTFSAVHTIMQEDKPNQKEQVVLRSSRIRELIPFDVPKQKTEEYVYNALKFYEKHRTRSDREER